MDLRREMEFDLRIIRPLRIQEPFTLSQIYKIPVLIFGDIGVFEPGEFFEFSGVLARDPTSLVERQGVELHRGAIFVQQAVLNNFELQFPYAADDLLITAILGEQLGHAFVCQL